MSRKPKLNLLYVPATETPWLRLEVVTPNSSELKQHANRWQGTRLAPLGFRELPPAAARTKH